MHNGECYRLLKSARHTSENGCLSSALWPTPTTKTSCNTADPADITNKDGGGWQPGQKPYSRKTGKQLQSVLPDAVRQWPTPTVQDAANNGGPSQMKRNTPPLNAVAGGALNPAWVEWLMGFPIGWTDLEESETPSSPSVSKNSADSGDG